MNFLISKKGLSFQSTLKLHKHHDLNHFAPTHTSLRRLCPQPLDPNTVGKLRHCLYAEKKLRSWKNFGLSGPKFLTNGQSKLRSWVLLSSVRVAKKVPSPRSKNIRPKTSDLRPSYLFNIQYVSHPSTYVGFSTFILNFYLRPTVNYSNECHFLLQSPTSVGIK
jgi:hypothetical protein